MFVTEKIAKAQFSSLSFGFDAGVERPIVGPQLIGGVASHPESFLVSHCLPRLGHDPETRPGKASRWDVRSTVAIEVPLWELAKALFPHQIQVAGKFLERS